MFFALLRWAVVQFAILMRPVGGMLILLLNHVGGGDCYSLTFIFGGALRFLLILPCFQQVPEDVRCAEAQFQRFFL